MTAKEPHADNQTYYKAYKFIESQRAAKKAPKSKKRKELEQALNKQQKQEELRRQTAQLVSSEPFVHLALSSAIINDVNSVNIPMYVRNVCQRGFW